MLYVNNISIQLGKNNRLDSADKKISELEKITIKFIWNKTQGEKGTEGWKKQNAVEQLWVSWYKCNGSPWRREGGERGRNRKTFEDIKKN